MRKTITTIAVVAGLLVALTGCGKADTITPPAPEPSAAASEPVAEPEQEVTPPSQDALVLAFDTMMAAEFGDGAVEGARAVATSFCDLVDTSPDMTTAVTLELSIALQQGVTPEQLGTVLGAGVPVYCPEYSAEFTTLMATLAG